MESTTIWKKVAGGMWIIGAALMLYVDYLWLDAVHAAWVWYADLICVTGEAHAGVIVSGFALLICGGIGMAVCAGAMFLRGVRLLTTKEA